MDEDYPSSPPRTSVPPEGESMGFDGHETQQGEEVPLEYEEEESMDVDMIDTEPHLDNLDEDAAAAEHVEKEDAVKTKKRAKKAAVQLEREPGKTLLPFARVQKIIKADKEIAIVAKDATFLISLATEEFIRRVSEAGSRAASRDNRTMVQLRDLASVVRRIDEFMFLEDILPYVQDTEPKRTSTVKDKLKAASAPGALDGFIVRPSEATRATEAGETSESSERSKD